MSTENKGDRCTCFYSYIPSKSKKTLIGPLCMNCMNDLYQDDPIQFHPQEDQESDVLIYLQTAEGGKLFPINVLIYMNGSTTPFEFRQLPKLHRPRLFNCVNPECDFESISVNAEAGYAKDRSVVGLERSSLDPPNMAGLHQFEAETVEGFSAGNCIVSCHEKRSNVTSECEVQDADNVQKSRQPRGRKNSKREEELESDKFTAKFPLLFGVTREQTSCAIVGVPKWRSCKRPIASALCRIGKLPDGASNLKKALYQRKWKTELCEVCPKVDVAECYVRHVTSSSHRDKVMENNRYLTTVHFDVLHHFIGSFLTKFDKKNKLKGLKSAPFSLWTRPLPFLKGDSKGLEESRVQSSLNKFRTLIEKVDLEVVSEYYPGYFCKMSGCGLCDVKFGSNGAALLHVLSEDHLEEMISSGRTPGLYEMSIMAGFFKQFIEKHVKAQTCKLAGPAEKVLQSSNEGSLEEKCELDELENHV